MPQIAVNMQVTRDANREGGKGMEDLSLWRASLRRPRVVVNELGAEVKEQ